MSESESELSPELLKLVRHLVREAVAELRKNPAMTSPWFNKKSSAAYIGVTERGLEGMWKKGTGPRRTKPTKKITRSHVEWLDEYMRNAEVEPCASPDAA